MRVYISIHTGVGHTDSESAQYYLTRKNSHKCFLCSWRRRASNLVSLNLESDALPTEPTRHSLALRVKIVTIPKGELHRQKLSPSLGRQSVHLGWVVRDWRTFCHLGSKSARTSSCNPALQSYALDCLSQPVKGGVILSCVATKLTQRVSLIPR